MNKVLTILMLSWICSLPILANKYILRFEGFSQKQLDEIEVVAEDLEYEYNIIIDDLTKRKNLLKIAITSSSSPENLKRQVSELCERRGISIASTHTTAIIRFFPEKETKNGKMGKKYLKLKNVTVAISTNRAKRGESLNRNLMFNGIKKQLKKYMQIYDVEALRRKTGKAEYQLQEHLELIDFQLYLWFSTRVHKTRAKNVWNITMGARCSSKNKLVWAFRLRSGKDAKPGEAIKNVKTDDQARKEAVANLSKVMIKKMLDKFLKSAK